MANATQQRTAGVPMAMQIWKHRRHGAEVKVVWAQQGKVGFTGCHACKSCETRCGLDVFDLPNFTNSYEYARAF